MYKSCHVEALNNKIKQGIDVSTNSSMEPEHDNLKRTLLIDLLSDKCRRIGHLLFILLDLKIINGGHLIDDITT